METAVLEIVNGVGQGMRLRVPEGAPRTVGGSTEVDLTVPEDPWIGAVHAAFVWERGSLLIKDLGTQHGTQINQEWVVEQALHDGDLVQMGGTLMRVHLRDPDLTHPAPIAPARPSFSDRLAHLRWLLSRQRDPVFAVLDAARDDRVLASLIGAETRFQSLYDGWQAQSLADVAPYLVALPLDGPYLDRLLELGFGRAWGIFLTSDLPFDELRRHLRQHLRVTDEDGHHLLFRWYDPRVLRAYLPTCTPFEAQVFFGPVERMFCEGPHGGEWITFTTTPTKLFVDLEPLPYPLVPTAFEGIDEEDPTP